MIYFIHNEIFKELSTSGKKQHFLAPTTYLFLLKSNELKLKHVKINGDTFWN